MTSSPHSLRSYGVSLARNAPLLAYASWEFVLDVGSSVVFILELDILLDDIFIDTDGRNKKTCSPDTVFHLFDEGKSFLEMSCRFRLYDLDGFGQRIFWWYFAKEMNVILGSIDLLDVPVRKAFLDVF